ncbi:MULTISPECIES: hypothetical protein [Spirosoma]|uniref:BamA/TamA family outer membrane protein n=1 Tax=Spirosoma liriopis TaxID=2937440 RepID=A0ABT0HMB9_9BACT|nr:MULTISPECIES: hypothetical protein [Spirosoma]MCK8493321.1 hypothetical protein [Spirosoma liriopis]UHG93652.1 hypothetical protein LQ777_07350 [Spirosoma oryzicola]
MPCRLLVWCIALLGAGAYGQIGQPENDSTRYVSKKLNDSLATKTISTIADSALLQRDSVFYNRLKTRMYKHRLTRQLYDLVFQDVYNSQVRTGEVKQIEVNPFKAYEGRIIGDIYIRRLGVFGHSVYDTLRKPGNWVERTGNRLHTNTREHIIRRSYLLFKEGDALNPTVLRDNERLLRTTSIFHDARILVLPRPGSRQFVDVYVITQDVWSLSPTGGVGALNQFSVGFEQRNFRGLGHQLFAQVAYSGPDPRQKMEYQGRYTVPFIGKTFLTAQAEVLYLRDLKQAALRLYRPFLTPDTKYAGSIELNHTQVNNRFVARNDSVLFVPLSYNYSDAWIGRSFRIFYSAKDDERKGRSRLILAIRNTNYEYLRRPTVTADTNQLYQDSRTTLFSIGYTRRRYVRDVLIYGYGRTEDVPVGEAISVVTGFDNAELGPRKYGGLNFSQGKYLRKLGYLYALVSIGGYIRNQRMEQGVFSLEGNYFSSLLSTRWGNMRHFFNSRFYLGINRFDNEYITLNSSGSGINTDGIGINNDALRGTNRWLINYETILFSKLNLAGFRIAFIGFANLGLISFPERPLLSSPVYQGYGIGFRLRNENLTFNSFQIRFAYYPNIPNNTIPLRIAFEGISGLRFRDFDLAAPQLIQYR